MPAAIKEWWRNLKLQLENEWAYRMSKRAGGMRWYKAELMAAHAESYRLQQVIESRESTIHGLKAAGADYPLETATKLLRMIEEILVEPVFRKQEIQMYELRSWRDDYWQFKIHVLNKQPKSEEDLLLSSTDGSIKVIRINK